jgi:hypothetical protein
MAATEDKEYSGGCHCGAYTYKLITPELTEGMVCDCSICCKKAYVWLFPYHGRFEVVKDGELASYNFGKGKLTHKVDMTVNQWKGTI